MYYLSPAELGSYLHPPLTYPVLAFTSASASFPRVGVTRSLQKYVVRTDEFKGGGREGRRIHVRNGVDLSNACKHVGEKAEGQRGAGRDEQDGLGPKE